MFNENIKRYLPYGWITKIANKLEVSRGTVLKAVRDPENPSYIGIIREVVELAKEQKAKQEAIKQDIENLSS